MTTINTNIQAINAQANMGRVNEDMNMAMNRLSSGMRINAANDDAAGMAIAEKMTSQIKGLNQAVRNATDGKNLVDTTEGAHIEISNMLQRVRELAVQSANDTNTSSDRNNLSAEANQLVTELNRVAKETTFNGMNILDGTFKGKQFQIGADTGQVLRVDVDSAAATDIGAHTMKTEASAADFSAETITISGHSGSEDVTTVAGDSAEDIAAKINAKTADTGVEASATTSAVLSGPVSGGADVASTVSFEINGVSTNTVAVPAAGAERLAGLRDAINEMSSQTGVTADINDAGQIELTDAAGGDISITSFSSSADDSTMAISSGDGAATATLTSDADLTVDTDVDIKGQVTLTSTASFSVATDTVDDAAGAATNSMFNTKGVDATEASADDVQHFASKLTAVSEIDLTTSEGSANAVKVIDVALQKISQSRSELGAVSNRLDSTISNLTNITVNVEASRSGVMDADFAKESSEMARGKLPEREALVLQLYYVEELNVYEVAAVLDVTTGRVSQIKKAAIMRLRDMMSDVLE